jgi:Fungal chitosanase of glycosyl hydrolase group 75
MQRLLRFVYLLLGTMLVSLNAASAQDLPPLAQLRAIVAKLPHRPQTRGTTFAPSESNAADPVCGLHRFAMMIATGSSSARSVPVLLDHKPADDAAAVTLLAVLHRVTVDADGSPRTYHPDDPHGAGTCTGQMGPDGEEHYSGICALDDFASAHLLVFHGTQKLGKGEFESPWKDIWPLIRDKKLLAVDLKQYVADAPDGYYFFYRKDRDLIALFKREIIPHDAAGYPCMRDTGYFVAATTLKQDAAALPNGCAPARYMDAEQIPFVVLPDDGFGNAHAGDIVVGRLAGAPPDRLIFGVIGDTGPIAQFGEASIAFNRALLGKSGPIMNDHDTDALDIDSPPVTVLLLGGTKALLGGDYSRRNIEAVGRAEFARWNGDPSHPIQRLDACAREYGSK